MEQQQNGSVVLYKYGAVEYSLEKFRGLYPGDGEVGQEERGAGQGRWWGCTGSVLYLGCIVSKYLCAAARDGKNTSVGMRAVVEGHVSGQVGVQVSALVYRGRMYTSTGAVVAVDGGVEGRVARRKRRGGHWLGKGRWWTSARVLRAVVGCGGMRWDVMA